MKIRLGWLVGVVLAAALAAGAGPAGAAGPVAYTCQGTSSSPGTIPGGTLLSLTMPAGSACVISSPVTVLSPVTLGDGSSLAVTGGSLTVQGPLTVGAGAVFDDTSAAPVTINGPVKVLDGGQFAVGFENPGAPVVSYIHGSLTGANANDVQVHNTQIGGPVTLQGGGGGGFHFDDLEDNQILGGVTITGYQGVWAGVIRNTIAGPFTFSNNTQAETDEYDIGSNTIYGPATCNDNNPVPNIGESPGGASTVFGPIGGDQAATCTGAA